MIPANFPLATWQELYENDTIETATLKLTLGNEVYQKMMQDGANNQLLIATFNTLIHKLTNELDSRRMIQDIKQSASLAAMEVQNRIQPLLQKAIGASELARQASTDTFLILKQDIKQSATLAAMEIQNGIQPLLQKAIGASQLAQQASTDTLKTLKQDYNIQDIAATIGNASAFKTTEAMKSNIDRLTNEIVTQKQHLGKSTMKGVDFEEQIIEALRHQNFIANRVTERDASGKQGFDIIVRDHHNHGIAIEAKSKINITPSDIEKFQTSISSWQGPETGFVFLVKGGVASCRKLLCKPDVEFIPGGRTIFWWKRDEHEFYTAVPFLIAFATRHASMDDGVPHLDIGPVKQIVEQRIDSIDREVKQHETAIKTLKGERGKITSVLGTMVLPAKKRRIDAITTDGVISLD
jgi:hypothetical protein